MPSRAEDSSGIDKSAYYLTLEGTTKHGLSQAVKAILRGEHGHVFFPNPAELRKQCNVAMKPHEDMRDRIARQERIRQETPPTIPSRTEAEKARVGEVMRKFHASYEREKHAKFEAERAEIRAKYGMTPEALASIKDAPLPAGMVQVGGVKFKAA